MGKDFLTVEQLKQLWQNELLPSIRKEVNAELAKINSWMKTLEERFQEIEKSQSFVSAKYDTLIKKHDSLIEAMKTIKSQVATTETNLKAAEVKINDNFDSIARNEDHLYNVDCDIDELNQYQRRDCLEITGIPVLSDDNPKQLVIELCGLIGEELDGSHISTAHRLPDTRKVKGRIIVKFVHRDIRE